MLHVENKLTQSVAIRYLTHIPKRNSLKKMVSERSLYRTLERIGRNVLHEKYQNFILKTTCGIKILY